MKNQLFPKEFMNSYLEHYTFKIGQSSSTIYLIILLGFILTLGLTPFIYVDIITHTNGLVDTKDNRYEIISPISGQIVNHSIIENSLVKSGEQILKIDDSNLRIELDQLNLRTNEIDLIISDLKKLIEGNQGDIKSNHVQIDYSHFKAKLNQLNLEKQSFERIYLRQKILYEQGIIAKSEFDQDHTNYYRTLVEIKLFKKQAISNWHEELNQLTVEFKKIQLRKIQIENELKRYILLAPSSGEFQNVVSISNGQYLHLGQKLATLTPDTTLVAICWVPPQKIGLLNTGMKGSFTVDAFHFNEWGFIEGVINKISSDAYLINNQPFFKIECELNKNYMQLNNGFIGNLKKGMTIKGHFIVANRSLYQLFYDKAENWLNPTRI